MMVVAYIPLLIAIVGLVLWAFLDGAKHPVAKKAGEWMFVIGFLWFVYPLTGKTFKIGG